MNETTRHLDSITTKIDQGQGTIGALINNKKIYENVNASAAEMKEDMEALKHNFFLRGFFKRRGYENAEDLKKNEIPKLPDRSAEKKFDYQAKRIFDKPETAELKNAKELNDAGNFLQNNPFGLAVITAISDMKGDTENDRLLTEARSMVVRDYLVKHFKVEDTRIKTIGLGKSDKAAEGGSIEILIYPEGTITGQLYGPSPSR